VAAYLLFYILHATHEDTVVLCQHALKNLQSQDQCGSLFGTIRGVYAGFVSVVLVLELCKSTRTQLRTLLVLIVLFLCSSTDCAIVATRYVYQVRGQKREARMPQPVREEMDKGRLLPGYVRYQDENGTIVYDSYIYPPVKDHERQVSAYSLASAEFEGATPMGLYDPPSGGLSVRALGEAFGEGFKDGYHDDDHRDQEHDNDNDRTIESSPGTETPPGSPHGEDSDAQR
jgi:hypothetical protein